VTDKLTPGQLRDLAQVLRDASGITWNGLLEEAARREADAKPQWSDAGQVWATATGKAPAPADDLHKAIDKLSDAVSRFRNSMHGQSQTDYKAQADALNARDEIKALFSALKADNARLREVMGNVLPMIGVRLDARSDAQRACDINAAWHMLSNALAAGGDRG